MASAPLRCCITFFEMDAEVLNGIVVVHVDGHIEIHAADGVHQRGKALSDPRKRCSPPGCPTASDTVLGQHGHAALVVGGVDLVGFLPSDDGLGITGDADAVDIAVHRIHSYQNVGVAAAVAVVDAGDQNGVEAALALQMGPQGLLRRPAPPRIAGGSLRVGGLRRAVPPPFAPGLSGKMPSPATQAVSRIRTMIKKTCRVRGCCR